MFFTESLEGNVVGGKNIQKKSFGSLVPLSGHR